MKTKKRKKLQFMVHGSGIDQTGLKCCVLALRTSWTTYQCQLLKLKFIMFIMYGGILSLTHSHLYHYWHIPTMVGFCHGGNMLGNHHHHHDCDQVVGWVHHSATVHGDHCLSHLCQVLRQAALSWVRSTRWKVVIVILMSMSWFTLTIIDFNNIITSVHYNNII